MRDLHQKMVARYVVNKDSRRSIHYTVHNAAWKQTPAPTRLVQNGAGARPVHPIHCAIAFLQRTQCTRHVDRRHIQPTITDKSNLFRDPPASRTLEATPTQSLISCGCQTHVRLGTAVPAAQHNVDGGESAWKGARRRDG
jgi:hypothetical protein